MANDTPRGVVSNTTYVTTAPIQTALTTAAIEIPNNSRLYFMVIFSAATTGHTGSFNLQRSIDGVNWKATGDAITITSATIADMTVLNAVARWYRIAYTPVGTAVGTTFNLQYSIKP
jgi:hypothetical protein